MNAVSLSTAGRRITEVLSEVGLGFQVVDAGVERVGSFEWAIARRSSTAAQAVVVAVTPSLEVDDEGFRLEISAGTDTGEQFRREVLYQDFVRDLEGGLADLRSRVDVAVDWIDRLGQAEFTSTHLVSRSRQDSLHRFAQDRDRSGSEPSIDSALASSAKVSGKKSGSAKVASAKKARTKAAGKTSKTSRADVATAKAAPAKKASSKKAAAKKAAKER